MNLFWLAICLVVYCSNHNNLAQYTSREPMCSSFVKFFNDKIVYLWFMTDLYNLEIGPRMVAVCCFTSQIQQDKGGTKSRRKHWLMWLDFGGWLNKHILDCNALPIEDTKHITQSAIQKSGEIPMQIRMNGIKLAFFMHLAPCFVPLTQSLCFLPGGIQAYKLYSTLLCHNDLCQKTT